MMTRALLAIGVLVALFGCDPTEPATPMSQPVVPVAEQTEPEPPPPPPPALPEGMQEWTRADALQKLAQSEDAVERRGGAIRLAQLNAQLPEQLSDDFVRRLGVSKLGDRGWGLGVSLDSVGADDALTPLQMPVLLEVDGTPVQLDYYADLAILYPNPAEGRLPDLLVTPTQVFVGMDEGWQPALGAGDLRGGWFTWDYNDGFPNVYVQHPEADERVIARYNWDVYETTFMGPLMQKAPDGLMALDLNRSPLLIPVGGHVPRVEAAEREPEEAGETMVELPPF